MTASLSVGGEIFLAYKKTQRVAASFALLFAVVGVILLPLRSHLIKRNNGIAMINAHALEAALISYAMQNGNQLPEAEHWEDSIQPYLGSVSAEDYAHLPHLIGTPESRLVMNSALSKRNIDSISHPWKVVLLFQSDENKAFGPLPTHLDSWDHRQRLIGFADGHVEQASRPLH